MAWPTSVLPKRSEWIWQIYYLSHLYLYLTTQSCEATSGAFSLFCSSVVVSNLDPRSSQHTAPRVFLPRKFRPVPSLQSSLVRTGRSISTSLESVTLDYIASHTSLAPS